MTRRIFVDTEWTAPPWSPGAELAQPGMQYVDTNTFNGLFSVHASLMIFLFIIPGIPAARATQRATSLFMADIGTLAGEVKERVDEWVKKGDDGVVTASLLEAEKPPAKKAEEAKAEAKSLREQIVRAFPDRVADGRL